MSIRFSIARYARTVFTGAFGNKNQSARVLILVGLLLASTAAVAAITSRASLRRFVFGSNEPANQRVSNPAKSAVDPAWATAIAPQAGTTMTVARRGHAATRLPDGRVLITGGENGSGVLNESEIYDPASGSFSAGGNMSGARADHVAVLLANGRVLLTGGRNAVGAVNTTEIFDPATGTFSAGANMSVARAGHSATLFADGRVLIAGGDAAGSAEIFDPSSGTFSAVGANLSSARSKHSAALLPDGRVLLVGGNDSAGNALSSGEIFDPAGPSFTNAGDMEDTRVRPTLRVLPDGKVQIIGGNDHRSLETYDPANSEFGAHAHIPPDGDQHANLISEIMSSPSRSALLTGEQTVTELGNSALAAGGVDTNDNATNASSLYASSGASVTTDQLDYAPGTPVVITGRGFQPNEIVDLTFHEDPHVNTENPHTFTVQADVNGNFTFDQYSPEEADLGITYILGTKGQSSGRTAQTTFTDGNVKAHAAPSGVTFTLTKTVYSSSTNCSTGAGSPSVVTGVDANGNTTGVGNTESIKLQAAAISDQGGAFINWTSSDPFTNLGGGAICVPGFTGGGTRDYFANYSTVTNTDVTITKTAGASPISAGDNASYTITANNAASGVAATNVVVTDTLPAGITWTESPDNPNCTISGGNSLSCTFASIASGGSASVTVTGLTTATNCGTLNNTATVTSNNDSNTGNNSASASITVQCPDVTVSKTADVSPISAGDTAAYTIVVTNNGPGQAKSVSLSDTLPSGVTWSEDSTDCSISGTSLTCNFGDLANGGSKTFHVTGTTGAANCGTLANTATVAATNEAAANQGNNSSSASIVVQCPDVTVSKTADVSPISAGDTAAYTIVVTNNGPGQAKSVSLSDTLPSGVTWSEDSADCSISGTSLTCNFGDLANGGSKTFHVTGTTGAANCGTLANTANVAATNEPASAQSNNSSSASIVVQCPDISVTKAADAAAVNAGDSIDYTITVSNSSAAGSGTAKSVTLSDTLPPNTDLSWSIDGGTGSGSCSISGGALSCNFGDMAPGATETVHITSATTPNTCGTVANTVSVSATNEASSALTNNSSGPINITVQCPDLKVQKVADAATVNAGDPLGFTVTLSNIGPGAAYGVSFTDALPAGLTFTESPDSPDWTISGGNLVFTPTTLAASGSSQVHVVATTSSENCGSVTNNASASASNEKSTELANNSASASVTVNCPDLKVEKVVDAGTVNAGDQLGFTVTLSNIGPGAAYGVSFTDALPAGLTFTESPDSPDWTISGGNLLFTPTTLLASGSSQVHIVATTSAENCGSVTNNASVSASNEKSTELANNTASASVTVNCPDLTVTKTADAAAVNAGDNIGYLITVNNAGPGTAYNVSLTDTLPGGLSWSVDGGTAGVSCLISGGSLSCNIGTLAPGSVTVHIKATTSSANCGTVSNSASASASNEANTANNSSDISTIAVQCPDISVTKTADATSVNAGLPIGFTITVSNSAAPGTGTARNVTLSDNLPTGSGMSWSEAPDNPQCSISGSALTCNFGDMAPGATKTVHVTSPTTAANCGSVTNTATASATNERSSDTGNNSATATITLVDVTAPVINLIPNVVQTLWPPDHKYVSFKVTDFVASVSDSCSSTLTVSDVYINKVTSDEPENINSGDGNTFKDMVIANDCRNVQLRAERDGSKNGRVYRIWFTVKDAAGNIGTASVKVTVPKSQGPGGAAVEDPVMYTVTNPNCP